VDERTGKLDSCMWCDAEGECASAKSSFRAGRSITTTTTYSRGRGGGRWQKRSKLMSKKYGLYKKRKKMTCRRQKKQGRTISKRKRKNKIPRNRKKTTQTVPRVFLKNKNRQVRPLPRWWWSMEILEPACVDLIDRCFDEFSRKRAFPQARCLDALATGCPTPK
jgi:hypothetical protein